VFFFLLFHTGLLVLILYAVCAWFRVPKAVRDLYLLVTVMVSAYGVWNLQPLWTAPNDGFESINSMIFFHALLFAVLGVYWAHEEGNWFTDLTAIAKTPLAYAIIAGLGFAVYQTEIPFALLQEIDQVYGITVPFALLIAGVVWGRYVYLVEFQEYLGLLPGLGLCLLFRLVISPLLAIGIVAAMGIQEAPLRNFLVACSAAPTSVLVLVLVSVYRKSREVRFVVLFWLLSSLLSLLALPLWQWASEPVFRQLQ
jgi:predicted permease